MKTTASTSCARGHIILKQSCKCCKSFRSDWENQLMMSGFQDIESGNGFTDHGSAEEIVQRHKDFHDSNAYEARMSYYQWAREKATVGAFREKVDQEIWEMHAEGISQRQIGPIIGLSQSWLSRKINRIERYLLMTMASISMERQTYQST